MTKKFMTAVMLAAVITLAGCSNGETGSADNQSSSSTVSAPQNSLNETNSSDTADITRNSSEISSEPQSSLGESDAPSEPAAETNQSVSGTTLEICFGDDGEPFTLYLYDNDTAAAIARHVGTADWRLPIYHFDDYDNWQSFQYYDVPSRYDIPSNAETVTSAKGGDVFYSEPNRIVLFYHDAEISAEYTKVGYFNYTDEFVSAVENNPVLEGWNTKMVLIRKDN